MLNEVSFRRFCPSSAILFVVLSVCDSGGSRQSHLASRGSQGGFVHGRYSINVNQFPEEFKIRFELHKSLDGTDATYTFV